MKLNDGWLSIIKNDEKLYKKFSKITTYINSNKDIIYPSKENIFKAFNLTDFN